MKSINEDVVEYKGEQFTRTSYNDISVLVDGDGYYNASKICKDNDTHFRQVSRYGYWTSYLEDLSHVCEITQVNLVRKRPNLPIDLRGTYIHKKLVNFLCFHVNARYAIKVGEIMDLIDEKNRLKSEALEKTIRDMKNENDRLKTLAVPINTNNKMLRVMRIDDAYKVSCDSHRTNAELAYPVVKTYIFASSMNIRQQLRAKKVIGKRLVFTDLEAFDAYIHANYTVLNEF